MLSIVKHHWHSSGLAILLAWVVCCSGCWEEIRYEPDRAEQGSSDESAGVEFQVPTLPGGGLTEGDASGNEPASTQQDEELTGQPTAQEAEPGAEVAGPATDLAGPTTPDATEMSVAYQAWQLGSQWSLAAGYQAKQAAPETYAPMLAKASAVAEQLQVDLPPLPPLDEDAKRVDTVLAYLLETSGAQLAREIALWHDAQSAATFQLAVESHALLLVYSPRKQVLERDEVQQLLTHLQQSARDSQLPDSLWSPLVELLDRHAPYSEVKQAVFTLHKQAAAYLAAGE